MLEKKMNSAIMLLDTSGHSAPEGGKCDSFRITNQNTFL